jgi:hypothetical protein
VSAAAPTGPALATPFCTILDGLCRAVAARAAEERTFAPVALLLWGWLRRVSARFAAYTARAAAGPLCVPLVRRRLRSHAQPPRPRLPCGFAWLMRAVPLVRPFAGQVQHFLATPEVADLLAAAPQVARHLRPLCRMLGVRPVPALPPPRRVPPEATAPAAPSAMVRPRPPSAAPPATPRPWRRPRAVFAPGPIGRSLKPS